MKGIVFCEFLKFVESKFSMDMVDDIFDDAKLPLVVNDNAVNRLLAVSF